MWDKDCESLKKQRSRLLAARCLEWMLLDLIYVDMIILGGTYLLSYTDLLELTVFESVDRQVLLSAFLRCHLG